MIYTQLTSHANKWHHSKNTKPHHWKGVEWHLKEWSPIALFPLFRPSQLGGHEPKLFWANVPTTILHSIRHVASQRRWVRLRKAKYVPCQMQSRQGVKLVRRLPKKAEHVVLWCKRQFWSAHTGVFSPSRICKNGRQWHTRYEVMLVFFLPLTCGHVGKWTQRPLPFCTRIDSTVRPASILGVRGVWRSSGVRPGGDCMGIGGISTAVV